MVGFSCRNEVFDYLPPALDMHKQGLDQPIALMRVDSRDSVRATVLR